LAGQIAVYQKHGAPLPATPSGVFAYESFLELQPPGTMFAPCASYMPHYFMTSCQGDTFARYLYATSWGPDQPTFSTGTRREPVADVEQCIGPTHAAPGVPYELEHEEWALRTFADVYGVEPTEAQRIDNYTACYPVARDGSAHVYELPCAVFPRLFVLNGLAGSGIARGAGAGEYLAQLVAASLGEGDGPPELAPPPPREGWVRGSLRMLAGVVVRALITGALLLLDTLRRLS